MPLAAIPSLETIVEALSKAGGNVSRAAKALPMPAPELRRLTRTLPVLTQLALELAEQRLDAAEQAVFDGLKAQRMKDRLQAADVMLRSAQARARGWGLGRQAQAPTETQPLPEIKWVEKS